MSLRAARDFRVIPGLFLAGVVLLASCAPRAAAPGVRVSTWGTMREVLRDGQTGGRVSLDGLGSRTSVGVGALEGLAGEVTILDGRVLVATTAAGPDGGGEPVRPQLREAGPGDSASLLVLVDVPAWEEVPLGDCASYAELEAAIARQSGGTEADPTEPRPVRVRGRATHLALHVIAGACPIADPTGAPPWRFAGAVDAVELVGVYVEGAAGRLTHHHRRSHLHAVADGLMGHLDEVALEDAVLLVPAARR